MRLGHDGLGQTGFFIDLETALAGVDHSGLADGNGDAGFVVFRQSGRGVVHHGGGWNFSGGEIGGGGGLVAVARRASAGGGGGQIFLTGRSKSNVVSRRVRRLLPVEVISGVSLLLVEFVFREVVSGVHLLVPVELVSGKFVSLELFRGAGGEEAMAVRLVLAPGREVEGPPSGGGAGVDGRAVDLGALVHEAQGNALDAHLVARAGWSARNSSPLRLIA